MDELISVIVPVYNVEKYLRECIDSIIRQTYKNIEIILIDDGSKDSSGQICDEYTKKDKRIKVIHQENRGVSSSRNLGIKKSNGKWITFVDSDDWLEDNFIEVLFNIAKRENADISISGYNRVQNSKIEKINISTEIQEYNSYEYLIKTLNPQTGLGFCHMRLIRKAVINNIQFDENLPVAEDALFNMQISTKINKAIHSNKNLYNYRNNSESVVKKYNEKYAQKYLEAMEAIKKYLEDNKLNDREIIQNYYNFVAYHVLLIAVNYCYHPNNPSKNKRQILQKVCNIEEFKKAIEKCNYQNITITRKITIFSLKKKLYNIVSIICKYRQIQNKGK